MKSTLQNILARDLLEKPKQSYADFLILNGCHSKPYFEYTFLYKVSTSRRKEKQN